MRRRRILLLAAGVAAVVLVCLRPFGGDPEPPPPPAPAPPPPAAAPPAPPGETAPAGAPATADPHPPGEEDHEDGLVTGEEDLAAADVPAAVRAAEEFAAAWSTPDPDWPEGVTGLATPELLTALERAVSAPEAGEVSGGGYLVLDAPEWARVGVPTERGTVLADVTLVDGEWLVSALAWWPQAAGSPEEGP